MCERCAPQAVARVQRIRVLLTIFIILVVVIVVVLIIICLASEPLYSIRDDLVAQCKSNIRLCLNLLVQLQRSQEVRGSSSRVADRCYRSAGDARHYDAHGAQPAS